MPSTLSLHDLTHVWPDGTVVLHDVDLDLGPGRHGLVGANGSGKSTLLRLLAELRPDHTAHLPQDPLSGDERSVADVLGVSDVRTALRAVEAGSTDPAVFDAVGDDWDVEERSVAALDRLGLGNLSLDREVETLSGGELVLLALGARLLHNPAVLLLDEPTNNLDRPARARLLDVVDGFTGTLVVASHDRDLLDSMDSIVEVRAGGVRTFGGGFCDYEEMIAAEQDTARQDVRDAAADLRKQRRELADTQVKLARRRRYGKKMQEAKREPKIVMGARKRAAEVSAGALRGEHEEHVAQARERLDEASDAVRDDREIALDLPATQVPSGRQVLTTEGLRLAHTGTVVGLDLRGPERVGLVGRNGSGKTTLMRTIMGELAPAAGGVRLHVPARHLPQRAHLLDDSLSVVDNVRVHAPATTPHDVRAQLARLLFRGRAAEQVAGTLSGGERLRATVACLLLAEPTPQLLMLDEPTNNLDLASVRHLVEALTSYRGALLVVSHDERFLDDLALDRTVDLDA